MNVVRTLKIMSMMVGIFSTAANALPRIAILEFELNDITSLPNTPEELKRTSSMAQLLMESLSRAGNYQVSVVDAVGQKHANAGFGYLFRFHDLAAKLGRQQGADWVLVGQHSKPSFLFSYLWVYLVDVSKQVAVARYDIELKGNHQKVTQHGIDALAEKVKATLARHRSDWQ